MDENTSNHVFRGGYLESNDKTQITQFRKRAKDLNRLFPKRHTNDQEAHVERPGMANYQENANQNCQETSSQMH